MVRSHTFLQLILTGVMAFGFTPEAKAIRYSLVNEGAGDQNGHTLSGYIEFDSPCGSDCSAANVIDFSFAVLGPNSYSYSYTSPDDVSLFSAGEPILNADPFELTFNFDAATSTGVFELTDVDNNRRPQLLWIVLNTNKEYRSYSEDFPGTPAWQTFGTSGVVTIGTVVPEPSTPALTLLAAAIVICAPGRKGSVSSERTI